MEKLKYKFAVFFSVLWPIGFSPFASGTVSSIFAAFIGFGINKYLGSEITLVIAFLTGLLGWWATRIYLERNNEKDPSEVVIDEFSGQLIATSFAGTSLILNILAFLLFRFFDILKPSYIGRSENIGGALGVMLDDWLAGLFSAIIILIISSLIKFNIFGY